MLLGKIKLYDIAKEFDMSSKDILAIAVKLKEIVRNQQIAKELHQ